MAKDEDNRTPEQLDAFASEAKRCGDAVRKQAEELMKQADEWDRIAGESRKMATQRRGRAVPDTGPKASKKSSRKH